MKTQEVEFLQNEPTWQCFGFFKSFFVIASSFTQYGDQLIVEREVLFLRTTLEHGYLDIHICSFNLI